MSLEEILEPGTESTESKVEKSFKELQAGQTNTLKKKENKSKNKFNAITGKIPRYF